MLSYLLLETTFVHRPVSYMTTCLHQRGLNPFWLVVGSRKAASLDGGARNEEPLVINPVNGLGSQILVPRDFEGASIHAVWRVRNGPIGPKQR